MAKPLTSSQVLYEKLLQRKKEFMDEALALATFKEEISDSQGNVSYRRPIIVLDEESRRGWLKRISMLNNLMDRLHKSNPDRYPLTCSLLRNRPQVINNVTYCRVHLNQAYTSRKTSPDAIIKRLELALRKLEKAHDAQLVISKDIQAQLILDSIKFFKSQGDRVIRIRTAGYYDVLAGLKINKYRYRPDDNEKVRVTDMGLFLAPKKNYKEIDFYQPEINLETPKNVVYKDLQRIPVPIPMSEELFWEDEVDQSREKVDGKKLADLIPIDMPPAV